MSGKLRLDTDTIHSASTHINRVVTRLNSAPTDANSLSSKIPVRDLRSVSVDFASKWELTRKELVEELQQVKQQLDAIVDAFSEVDQGLTNSLQEGPKRSASGPTPTPM